MAYVPIVEQKAIRSTAGIFDISQTCRYLEIPLFSTLRMHKFFCSNPECKFRTFAEQLGIEVFRYRRRTRRCEVVQNQHAVKHSSITAGKTLSLQGIRLSGSAILRDLHRMLPPAYTDVLRIGVDDWAQRKRVLHMEVLL